MLRAFFFIVQVFVLVLAAIWIARRPGQIEIEWMQYTVTTQLGYLLLALFVFIFFTLIIYRLVISLLALPEKAADFRRKRLHERGYRALLQGFAAIASNDGREAVKLARKAREKIYGDDGLLLLLEAQAHRLAGDFTACEASLEALKNHKYLSYLGARGMVKLAAERGQIDKALKLAREAMNTHPGQPGIIRMAYQLQLKHRNWEEAERTLHIAARKKAVSEKEYKQDMPALLTAQAGVLVVKGDLSEAKKKLGKALKICPSMTPAALHLVRLYNQEGRRGNAVRIIKRAWKESPHPELAREWENLAPKRKPKDPEKNLRWPEKLLSVSPESAESHLLVAKAAMNENLWGEARAHLKKAEELSPDTRIYKMRANLEEKAYGDPAYAATWLDKAASAPQEKSWVCSLTGMVYDSWAPVAEPHGAFNTIVWDVPGNACVSDIPVFDYPASSELLPIS
jgi:HemY protein